MAVIARLKGRIMYKDKDKQREANKEAMRRSRAKGITNKPPSGITEQGITQPKRGKDIQCFEDLPPDVQQTINRLSLVDGKIDQTIKAKRTAIAINYQHLYPDRYYSTGVECVYMKEQRQREGAAS